MARPATVAEPILDGQALIYKRPDSALYQVRFKVGRQWYIRSTGTSKRAEAVERAQEMFFEIRYKDKLGIPVATRTFGSIAAVVLKELQEQAGEGKTTQGLYAGLLQRFLIPFFGKYAVTSIGSELLREHDKWRTELVGRKLKAISVKQQNVALQRVFDKAVELKLLLRHEIPTLLVTGDETESRPSFSLEEYRVLYRYMRKWVRTAETRIQRERRDVMRAMVLAIANTGMRPMNEVISLKWSGVRTITKDGKSILTLTVDGKTGRRTLVAKGNVAQYLARIKYEGTAEAGHVFVTPNGKILNAPAVLFKELLTGCGLLVDPLTGEERTLYSLRHFYATMALVYSRVPIYTLAKQMGTSVKMIESHYSKLTPLMASDQLS